MAEYPSNSHKAKESSLVRDIQRDSAPTQQGRVGAHPSTPQASPQKKLSPVHEVFKALFPGGVEEIKSHLLWDIFVPWMQDMLHDGWSGLGDVIFPGSDKSRQRSQSVPEHYSYNAQYRISDVSYSGQQRYYDEMRPMRTEKEARDALNDLKEIWMRYKFVTLLDFNERVGNPTRPTQDNYGWLSLDSADVVRTNGGWVISMPRAVPIDNLRSQ